MTRLMVEYLEGRELMSADVSAGLAPSPFGVGGSTIEVSGFTPPIGSNKGSLVGTAPGEPQANGIIAILIGLRDPRQGPTGGAQETARVLPYMEQGNLYKT